MILQATVSSRLNQMVNIFWPLLFNSARPNNHVGVTPVIVEQNNTRLFWYGKLPFYVKIIQSNK